MNVTLEKTSDLEAKLRVDVTESDYSEKVTKELKEVGRTHTIPGFRKGHVPASQLQRMFGRQVKSDVINHMVYDAVIDYLKENKVEILGEPMPVEVKEIDLNQKDYTFEYELGLMPSFEVKLDKDVKIPYYSIEVTKEMLDQQDAALRDRFGAQVPGEEVDLKALVKGPIMELNEDGTIKEGEDAIQMINGIVSPFHFTDKAQSEKFLGKKIGDKVVFNPAATCNGNVVELASMLGVDKERVADLKSDFEMTISEIIVLRPAEHGEEFYKEVFAGNNVTTEEQYWEELKKMVAAQLAPNSEWLFTVEAEKTLVEKFGNFDLPSAFLKRWLVSRNEGLTDENIDEEYAKMTNQLKWQLIKGKIVEQLDVKVTMEDLQAYALMVTRRQFAQYGMTNLDDEALKPYAQRMIDDKNAAQRMAEEVGDRKFFFAVKATVDATPKEVTMDEFRKIADGLVK